MLLLMRGCRPLATQTFLSLQQRSPCQFVPSTSPRVIFCNQPFSLIRAFTSRHETREVGQVRESYDGELKSFKDMTTKEKVVQTGKDFTYLVVIGVGLVLVGGLGYVVFQELFSRTSPGVVMDGLLKLCRSNGQLTALIGKPLTGYGEENSRRRRRRVSNVTFKRNGWTIMRLTFHVSGPQGTATIDSEICLDGTPEVIASVADVSSDFAGHRTIVLKDNRERYSQPKDGVS